MARSRCPIPRTTGSPPSRDRATASSTRSARRSRATRHARDAASSGPSPTAPMQYLALRHQLFDRTGHILDRYLRIDTVLIKQIDAIRPQALFRSVDDPLDVLGPAVEARLALAGLQIDVPAELGRDHDLVAERRDAFAQDAFHFVRAVGLGGVEERDSSVERSADDVVHLRARRHGRLVRAAHVLHAQADAGNLQRSELAAAGALRPGAHVLGFGGGAPGDEWGRGQAGSPHQEVATTGVGVGAVHGLLLVGCDVRRSILGTGRIAIEWARLDAVMNASHQCRSPWRRSASTTSENASDGWRRLG